MNEFDCVEMKRRVQAEIYEDIRDLSDAERDAWFHQRAASSSLASWWSQLKTVEESRAEEARRLRRQ